MLIDWEKFIIMGIPLNWDFVGKLANVEQLVGAGISVLISVFITAFWYAYKHEENRRRLEQKLTCIDELRFKLETTDIMRHPENRNILEHLGDVTGEANDLVYGCQNRSYLYLLVWAWAHARRFSQAKEEIYGYVNLSCLMSAVANNSYKERSTRIQAENRSRKAAIKGFKQLLDEVSTSLSHETSYESFAREWGNDQRFGAIDRTEKESLLNERVLPLKRAFEEREKAMQYDNTIADFKAMLGDTDDIDSNSLWSWVKNSLRSDPRYKAVRSEDRKTLFNEYVVEMRAAEQEKERAVMAKRKEEERCTRIRNGKKYRKAAVKGFKQLLDEASICITHETTYESFARQWGNDQRFGAIDRTQKESLLNERVLSSRIAFKEKEKAIETAGSIASRKAKLGDRVDINSSWPAVNGSLSSDPRYKAAKRRRKNRVDYVAEMRATEEDTERATIAERKKENLTSDQNQRNVNGDFRTLRVQLNNFDAKEMAVIECLLKSTPALETMEIRIPRGITKIEEKNMQFVADILLLPRASSQARICMQLK